METTKKRYLTWFAWVLILIGIGGLIAVARNRHSVSEAEARMRAYETETPMARADSHRIIREFIGSAMPRVEPKPLRRDSVRTLPRYAEHLSTDDSSVELNRYERLDSLPGGAPSQMHEHLYIVR